MKFYWTATSLIASIVTLLIAAVCCLVSWRRADYGRTMGLLELFRFVLICLVVVTLNQPEVSEQVRPDEQPVLAVLYDTSDSMQTRDVAATVKGTAPAAQDEDDNSTVPRLTPASATVISRADAIKPLIDESAWRPLDTDLKVVLEPFSSTLPEAARGTDLNAALSVVSERHTGLRAVVLMSDGDWNTGSVPSAAATDLRMRGVPVYSVGTGSEDRLPDMELVSSGAPTFGLAGKTLRIPFRVSNWLARDQTVTVRLDGTGGAPVEKIVQVAGMGRVNDTLEWKTKKTGDYKLRLSIPVANIEAISDNNTVDLPINIRHEALRVLVVESFPRWEYRYLRNALERDPGVDVHCLLFHPELDDVGGGRGYLDSFPEDTDLFRYDVVFLGDVGVAPDQLSDINCVSLRQLVRSHAGGLVFLPGFRGYQQTLLATVLDDLYPVVPDETQPKGIGSLQPARFSLTESGRRSLLTRLEPEDERNEEVWRSLPGFQWYAATARARIGADVLVTHDSDSTRFGRVPLVATRTSGTGKVLFMGTDGAWRWRKGVEDLYHYRFWGQVVRWMAYQRNMSQGESMRLFYSPDRPEAKNEVALNANVMQSTGEPLRDGVVTVQVTSPSGQKDSIRLLAAGEDSWGLFTGTFTPKEGGQHQLITTCDETDTRLETTMSVQGQEREQIGQPARFDVLKEISEISRGRVTTVSEVPVLLQELAALPEPNLMTRRFRIWSHPAWGGLLILLLSGFWSCRKLAGLA